MASNPPFPSANMPVPTKKQRRDDDKPSQDAPKPSSSIAQLARRRVWRACESCRRKKIKCDGNEPICGQCSASGAACTWIQTRDRAALSRHYVQELENRLLKLETVLTNVAPNLDLNTLAADAEIPVLKTNGAPASIPPTDQVPPSAKVPQLLPPAPISNEVQNTSTQPRNSTPASAQAVKSEEADEFVAEQMGSLALDDHGHLRWIGGSSTMSLIEAFRNFSGEASDRDLFSSTPPETPPNHTPTPNPPSANVLYFPSSLQFGKVRALPGADEVEYPPIDLANKLVEAYFHQFHHTLPVLDSLSFRAKYSRLMEMRENARRNGTSPEAPTTSEAGFLSVVFAVFAVAARFVSDDRLKTDDADGDDAGGMGMVYYERAMILYYIGATATQLAHVQAFVLLSSFLASLNCLPQSWLLCGQAVRIAQDLGLHRSPKNLIMSYVNKETRRRVWWCVYGLDRMLAVALGRPLGVEDSDCDVEMPLPVDDHDLPAYFASLSGSPGDSSSSRELPNANATQSSFDSATKGPSLMAGFNALTDLYRIAGKILRSVYAVNAVDVCKENAAVTQANVEKLDKELNVWCEKLPPTFKSDPRSMQEVSLGAILCSSYYSALITLHRNFLPTRKKGIANPNWSSVPKAVFASRSCILLSLTTKDAIPPSHHLAFFVQALFSAAVIILLCARFATVESAARTATEEVNTSLQCLSALENSWPGARKCKELLEDLAEVTKGEMRVSINVSFGKNATTDAMQTEQGQPGVIEPTRAKPLVPSLPASVPRPVESVQTIYSSYKRAAPKTEEDPNTFAPVSATPAHAGRKIKPKPKERKPSMSGHKNITTSIQSQQPRSQQESPTPSTPSKTSLDMDYQLQLNHSPTRPLSGSTSPTDMFLNHNAFSSVSSSGHSRPLGGSQSPPLLPPGMAMSAMDQSSSGILSSPALDLGSRTSSFTFGSGNPTHLGSGGGSSDWNMGGTGIDSSFGMPMSYMAHAGGAVPPNSSGYNYLLDQQAQPNSATAMGGGGFDMAASGVPFTGFDWLQNFGAGTESGFGAGDVAAWQSFVQTGAFNDVPDQPFALHEGAGGSVDMDDGGMGGPGSKD